MYEDWANERITEYNFNMMSERYQNEQQELDEKIRTLEAELLTGKKVSDNAEKLIAVLKQYSNPTELTAEQRNFLCINKVSLYSCPSLREQHLYLSLQEILCFPNK